MTNQFTKRAYKPVEVPRDYPVGLTRLYELMNNGTLRFKTIGGSRIIPTAELERVFCELDTAPEDKAA